MTANTYLIDAQTRKASYHPVTAFDPICYLVQSPAVFVVDERDAVPEPEGHAGRGESEARRADHGGGRSGLDVPDGLHDHDQDSGCQRGLRALSGQRAGSDRGVGPARDVGVCGLRGRRREREGRQAPRAGRRHRAARIEPLPNVATFAEQGFQGLEVDNWFGVVAPAGTPKEVLAQLGSWFKAALAEPDVKAKLAPLQGLYPIGQCGDEFAAYVKKRFGEYGEMMEESNIKTE